MTDYISRQAAFEALEKRGVSTTNISRVPIADVRENVRGEWLPHPIKGHREWDVCSACGKGCKRREFGIHANGKKWVTEYNFPFCPNCGAEMGGDNNV